MKKNNLLKLCCSTMTFIYLLSTALPIAYADGGTQFSRRRLDQVIEEKKESYKKPESKKKPTRNVNKVTYVNSEDTQSETMEEIEIKDVQSGSMEGVQKMAILDSSAFKKMLSDVTASPKFSAWHRRYGYQFTAEEKIPQLVSELKLNYKNFCLPAFKNIKPDYHIDLIIGFLIQLKDIESSYSREKVNKFNSEEISKLAENFYTILTFSDQPGSEFELNLREIERQVINAIFCKNPTLERTFSLLNKEYNSSFPFLTDPLNLAINKKNRKLLTLIGIICYLKIFSSDPNKTNLIEEYIKESTKACDFNILKSRFECFFK